MTQPISPTYQLIQLLAAKQPATLEASANALLKTYQSQADVLVPLKQCLKAWGVPFTGDQAVAVELSEADEKRLSAQFGPYFSKAMYPRFYALCQAAYAFEKNGIPAEHATKLCVLFDDQKAALSYLLKYAQSVQNSTTPLHDACSFVLPDFQAPGFLDPKTGCKFEFFQAMAKTGDNMLSKSFNQLLPFAFELQKQIVAAKIASKSSLSRATEKTFHFTEEMTKLKDNLAIYEKKLKELADLTKKQEDTESLIDEIDELKEALNTHFQAAANASTQWPQAEKNQMIEQLERFMKITRKRYEALGSQKSELDGDEEEEYHALATVVSEQQCALATLCAGKLLKELSLVQLSAFYEVLKRERSQSYKLFIDNGIPDKYHAEFKSLDRTQAGLYLPDVIIPGETLGHPGFYLMKVPVASDERQAARAACFGKLTDCCQSLSGEAGHACAKHGLTSPNGGFYVLCRGDAQAPKVTDPVVAQTWAWRSQSEAIVFDSIETADKDPKTKQCTIDFFHHLGKHLVINQHTAKVVCGAISGISSEVGFAVNDLFSEMFKDYEGYSDAKWQRVIYDESQPYLWYAVSNECKAKMQELIEELANRETPVRANKPLIKTLNWTYLQDRADIREMTQAAFAGKKQADELQRIIETLKEYHEKHRLQMMVEHLDDVNLPSKEGHTPLMFAAMQGDAALCLRLIEKGAQTDVKNHSGKTLLMCAAQGGLLSLCETLLQSGVDINESDRQGDTPLLLAVKNGHADVCLALLDKGAQINVQDKDGMTPLLWAAQKGLATVYDALVNKGADVQVKDPYETTLLMHCAKSGLLAQYHHLIEQGADIHVKNIAGETLLMCAAQSGLADVCLSLIQHGLDINARDAKGKSALLLAAQHRHHATCRALIGAGAMIDNSILEILGTPDLETQKWRQAIIQDALQSQQNIRGNQQLIQWLNWAVLRKRKDILQEIDALLPNDEQRAALQPITAALEQYQEQKQIKAIIETLDYVDVTDSFGKTPLMYAAQFGRREMCLLLLAKGADINVKDTSGRTALLAVADIGRHDMCDFLIENGADLDIRDKLGSTLLMRAIKNGQVPLSLLLMDKGANLNNQDLVGKTPLKLAIEKKSVAICEALIRAGATLNEKTIEMLRDLNQPEINAAIEDRLAPKPLFAPVNIRRSKEIVLSSRQADNPVNEPIVDPQNTKPRP